MFNRHVEELETHSASASAMVRSSLVAKAQDLIEYLDQATRDAMKNPDGQIPVQILNMQQSTFAQDVFEVCQYLIEQFKGEESVEEQPKQEMMKSSKAFDLRSSFINAMRQTPFPGASDETVSPGMLANLVRAYLMGRIDTLRNTQGGWKEVEKIQQAYHYVTDPAWMPDPSYRWWAQPVSQSKPAYKTANNSVASHMQQSPQW